MAEYEMQSFRSVLSNEKFVEINLMNVKQLFVKFLLNI